MGKLPAPNPNWNGANPDPGSSYVPYKIYNIGNNNPVELNKFIQVIENALGRRASKEYLDLQPGDVVATYADVDDLMHDVGFKPQTSLETGIQRFVDWFKAYHDDS
jgi:UDP-glucuronate 4-epimerase